MTNLPTNRASLCNQTIHRTLRKEAFIFFQRTGERPYPLAPTPTHETRKIFIAKRTLKKRIA
jgi:hypothetical protein